MSKPGDHPPKHAGVLQVRRRRSDLQARVVSHLTKAGLLGPLPTAEVRNARMEGDVFKADVIVKPAPSYIKLDLD